MADLSIFAQTVPLERVSHYTPLGIRFWDPALGRAVTDGLAVTLLPSGRPVLTRRAFRRRAGVYAFEILPGFARLEFPDPDRPPQDSPPTVNPPLAAPFLARVVDRLGRYLPTRFSVMVPQRGIYPTQPPPGPDLPGFFLFSAPARPATASLGLVRAQLAERLSATERRPAAFAVLEVRTNGGPAWQGIADAAGRVAVFFPFPPFVFPTPPPADPTPRWDVTVRVRYQSPPLAPAPPHDDVPDLAAVLNQPAAQLRSAEADPPLNELTTRAVFGRPLELRTGALSELLIEP